MLQFATPLPSGSGSPAASPEEAVKAALAAGCQWIRLRSVPEQKMLDTIVDACRTQEAILMIDNDADLVARLRTHGVHLTQWTRGEVIAVREKLGPHAAVGVSCSDASALEQLKGLDVDYVVTSAPAGRNPADFFIQWMEHYNKVRAELTDGAVANMTAHPVAGGPIPVDLYPSVIATGVAGVEFDGSGLTADEIENTVRLALRTLGQYC